MAPLIVPYLLEVQSQHISFRVQILTPKPPRNMEISQIYAIAAGSFFALLTIVNFLLCVAQKIYSCNSAIFRHVLYPFLLRRHRVIGPWTRNGALWRTFYLVANILFTVFPSLPLLKMADRAGHLSLINMMPLFFGPHLSFLADTLGVSLQTYHRLHGASAAMTIILLGTHVALGAFGGPCYRRFVDQSQVAGLIVRATIYGYFLSQNKESLTSYRAV